MELYKVIPSHLTFGYKAPALYEIAEKEDQAIKQAKKRSRLSDFPEVWFFSCQFIRKIFN